MRRNNLHASTSHVTLDASMQAAVSTAVLDVDGAMYFQRELEHVKSKSYDVQYPELLARTLFPVSNEAGAGVNTITYRTYDQVGAAKIISAYADDLPRADVSGKETSSPVRSVGTSYGYNVDEIEAGALTGRPLDQRRANAAVKSTELAVNDVAFNGDAAHGLPGFFSNPNIPKGNVVNPGSGTEWVNKTPDQILFDINDLFADIFETTKMVERGNTLLLPPSQWAYISATPRASNSDTTILEFIVKNSPFLTSAEDVIPVNELVGAGTAGVDIMVAYDRSPDKLELEVPLELQWFAIQQKGLEFVVPGRLRLGGLNIYYPLSLSIGEGI